MPVESRTPRQDDKITSAGRGIPARPAGSRPDPDGHDRFAALRPGTAR
ncbi:MAG: hypothetical protein JO144_04915 [Actinobacteria bacterium]|nr:hypothetical protein [Actinomycetota bacterium]